jgi:L-amino acid N-acyltransferase YncA
MTAREATPEDAAAICAIYNQGIEDRSSTFETRPRTPEEIGKWFDGVHPIVVVEDEGEVIAYAASSLWRTRDCYRGIAEFGVYVRRDRRKRGAGRAAMDALCEAARKGGYWKLLGALFVDNQGSRALLKACGFREAGRFEKQARLDGKWRDVVMFEKLFPENQ